MIPRSDDAAASLPIPGPPGGTKPDHSDSGRGDTGRAGDRTGEPGTTPALIDDRGEPSVRQLLGHVLARAEEADFAVARIRLAAVDLAAAEVVGVRRCRVLVGRLDADALTRTGRDAGGAPARASNTAVLLDFLDSGRLEVRAAGLAIWMPDFSVLRGVRDAPGQAVTVVGAHYFARPYTHEGPAFTCVIAGSAAAAMATLRFEELWRQGYDVAHVVRESLERLAG